MSHTKVRVSIEELEAILQEEEDDSIEILPSGEIVRPGTTTGAERGHRVPLTYKEDLGGEYSADLSLIRRHLAKAQQHFPNAQLLWEGSKAVVKTPLKTSAGRVYVVVLRFPGYPYSMPEVHVTAPSLPDSCPHRYRGGRLCYLHPSVWNPGRHDVRFVLMRAAKWLNKMEVWRQKGRWPGAQVAH